MGYYTNYTLTHNAPEEKWQKIYDTLKQSEDASYALQLNVPASFYDTKDGCKWDHEKDIIAISNAFPDVLFDLYGDGEEQGDVWHFYAMGGKGYKQMQVVTWPNFDPEKLRTMHH